MTGGSELGKRRLKSIAEKNAIVRNIVRTLEERDGFLLIGHHNPDEDCIASMVAFGLLASKFNRSVCIYTCGAVQDQFGYLFKICTYNSIAVVDDCSDIDFPIKAVVALDTPKPDMLELNDSIRKFIADPTVVKVEIDHHLGSDSSYFGDEGYCLVDEASSASELVGLLALKMQDNPELMARHQLHELMTRNLVLAILTGIIGDSRMGKYLKTRRERWFYERFSSIFDEMLAQKTRRGTSNFTSKEEVFNAIASLSTEEEKCFRLMAQHRKSSKYVECIVLSAEQAESIYASFGGDTMNAVAKSVADSMAEEGGYLSLIAYPDPAALSSLVQFRVRRSQSYRDLDLREVLSRLNVVNGGGHPGAVGFRFEKSEVPDLPGFAESIVIRLEAYVREAMMGVASA
jgi:nanoRNase/pAp phosphatase (c-di-AMP/oligoRNAs hydrolase)